MYEIVNALVPAIPADRQLALDPLQKKVDATHQALLAVRMTHGALVESLARIDTKKLQPRIKADLFPVVGKVRQHALDLRSALDHADVPVDIRDGLRAAIAATNDGAFTAAAQSLTKAVDRYAGSVAAVDTLVRLLDAALATLATLADADMIFSDTFVVPAPAGQTWSRA